MKTLVGAMKRNNIPDPKSNVNGKRKTAVANPANKPNILKETSVNSSKKSTDKKAFPVNEKEARSEIECHPCVDLQEEMGQNGSKITIHVCDEARKIEKDFRCGKDLLLSQMKYFEKFQPAGNAKSTALEDLDISVHCDIQIFEWLMKYLLHPQAQFSTLEVSNVVSILISADYLQMEHLVDECTRYIKDHIHEIIKLPIDTSCISSAILKKLSALIDIQQLDEEKDRKDKLVSKLFMKKLELLLEDENNTLFRCVYCNKLFTRTQKSWMVCSKANIFIDFHGKVIAEHVADRAWDINKFIHYLRQQGSLGWREIYWKMWAHLVHLHCSECDCNFVGAEIAHCSFHSSKATFGKTSDNGTYPCCGVPAIRFDAAQKSEGCKAKNHKILYTYNTSENENIEEILNNRLHIVAEPFICMQKFSEQIVLLEDQLVKSGRLTQQTIKNTIDSLPLSKIEYSPSIQIMLHKYVQSVGESGCSISEDEDEVEETTISKSNIVEQVKALYVIHFRKKIPKKSRGENLRWE